MLSAERRDTGGMLPWEEAHQAYPEHARQLSSLQSLCRQTCDPPQPPTYLILGRNICDAVGPPAGSGHLSACFLMRVCGGVVLICIKAALRAMLPGGLAPCISISSPPIKKGREAWPLAPHHGLCLGCGVGMGAKGCR